LYTNSPKYKYCDAIWEIYYLDEKDEVLAEVDTTWATVSWDPSALTCDWNILVCSESRKWYIMQACNLWAMSVWDTNESASYGNYHQWGNNWGWDITSPVMTGTRPTCTENSTMYFPSFVSVTGDWCSAQTDNIWWDITDTLLARKWPCAEGYHVPTNESWLGIISSWWGAPNGTNLSQALKLPFAWRRYTFSNYHVGTQWYYWSSTPNTDRVMQIYFTPTLALAGSLNIRANTYPVRCIRN
jgi:hypothetical protein